ncbi:MAG: RNA ligase family protein [Euzebyales bacterium]|nr:RNA ligase family protein [Euzebyales bacterium]
MSAKYPRTPHLPGSLSIDRDDRVSGDLGALLGVDVVVTEKLDGANVCLLPDALYARSHSGPPSHPAFDHAKAAHARVAWRLPEHVSVFAEHLHAVHSVVYPELPSEAELQVFGARDDLANVWWAWDDVVTLARDLVLPVVPELWRGIFRSGAELQAAAQRYASQRSAYGPDREGVVIRAAARFSDGEFGRRVVKWVRGDHAPGAAWSRTTVRRHQRV